MLGFIGFVLIAASAVHAVNYPNYELLLASQKSNIIISYIQDGAIKHSPTYEAPATSDCISCPQDSVNAYGKGSSSNWFSIDAEFALAVEKVFDSVKTMIVSDENKVKNPKPEVDYSFVDDLGPKNVKENIYSHGDFAQVEFVFDSSNGYTGLFQGSRFAFASFSYSADEISSIAFKLLRDGQSSANIIFLPVCQWNYVWSHFLIPSSQRFSFDKKPELFHQTFSNHPRQFMRSPVWDNHLGLSNMAQFTESGEKLRDEEILFPYEIHLEPTSIMKGCSSLTNMTEGAVLYSIFASSQPKNHEGFHRIGEIRFKRSFSKLSSNTTLFFRDQPFEDDLMHRNWMYEALGVMDGDCRHL